MPSQGQAKAPFGAAAAIRSYIFVGFFLVSPVGPQAPPGLPHVPIQCLAQYLALMRCSLDICLRTGRINEWMGEDSL